MNNHRRQQLICNLKQQAQLISKSDNVNEMILIHEMMISALYIKNPLFYKVLFKYCRFYVASSILAIYYHHEKPMMKDIKEFFVSQKGIISTNTLNAFIFQLRLTNRIEVYKNDDNRRPVYYRPTNKLIIEIKDLIQCLLKPYTIFNSTISHQIIESNPEYIADFFSRYGEIMLNHITMLDLLPESSVFIDKDAGHMIMLSLYKAYLCQNSSRIALSSQQIAEYCHVSRSHVYSVLLKAEEQGFILFHNNVSIELSNSFLEMFRMYFSLYLAKVLYGIRGDTEQ